MRDVLKIVARYMVATASHKLGMCACSDNQQGVGWVEYSDLDGSEFLPIDDLLEHERGYSCACLPQVAYREGVDGDEWATLHHAWDGRE